MKIANMRQVMFKDLFATAMETMREKLWSGGQYGGWGGKGIRTRARAMARKLAREALRGELGTNTHPPRLRKRKDKRAQPK